MSEKRIQTLADIAALTPDEFERFLPDLIAWHGVSTAISAIGATSLSLNWCDDGRPGIMTYIDLTVGDKTERVELGGVA